ncbi:MAG: hypothetical protein C5S38_08605 [Candidatus Methanophagaceae archaeon]|nr:MAG: hypothetical protein C5S38_08605 [Methanophagales archaeon]
MRTNTELKRLKGDIRTSLKTGLLKNTGIAMALGTGYSPRKGTG